MLGGEDLRPWYQENEGLWLICLPTGWTMKTFPDLHQDDEFSAWRKLSASHPGLATHLETLWKQRVNVRIKVNFGGNCVHVTTMTPLRSPKFFGPLLENIH